MTTDNSTRLTTSHNKEEKERERERERERGSHYETMRTHIHLTAK